jgi:hypothetical protein
MSVAAAPNYGVWLQRYPEFGSSVSQVLYEQYFREAALYHDNSGIGGPVCDPAQQLLLLNMLVSHIARIYTTQEANIVGRIANSTEGSVSIALDMPATANAEWYNSTPYGASYWRATAQFRTMRYRPAARRFRGPWAWWPY